MSSKSESGSSVALPPPIVLPGNIGPGAHTQPPRVIHTVPPPGKHTVPPPGKHTVPSLGKHVSHPFGTQH